MVAGAARIAYRYFQLRGYNRIFFFALPTHKVNKLRCSKDTFLSFVFVGWLKKLTFDIFLSRWMSDFVDEISVLRCVVLLFGC